MHPLIDPLLILQLLGAALIVLTMPESESNVEPLTTS